MKIFLAYFRKRLLLPTVNICLPSIFLPNRFLISRFWPLHNPLCLFSKVSVYRKLQRSEQVFDFLIMTLLEVKIKWSESCLEQTNMTPDWCNFISSRTRSWGSSLHSGSLSLFGSSSTITSEIFWYFWYFWRNCWWRSKQA